MSDQLGTLEQIALSLGKVLARTGARLAEDQLRGTLAQLGLVFPPALLQLPAVISARNALTSAADDLPHTIDQLVAAAENGDLSAILQQGGKLRTDAVHLIENFASLPTAIDASRSAFPEITDAAFSTFADAFPRKLLDLLTTDALDAEPGVGGTLRLVGLIDWVRPFETDPDPDIAYLEQCTVRYDRIAKLLSSPLDYFLELYQWGSPQFDGTRLLPALDELLAHLALPTSYHAPTESNPAMLEAYVVDITPTKVGTPPGLDFTVNATFGGSIDESVGLPAPGWTGRFTSSGTFATAVTATLRPPMNLAIASTAALEGKAEATLVRDTGMPVIVIGSAGGSRLEVGKISLGLSAAFSSVDGSLPSPALAGALHGGHLLIDGSNADGFISLLLGGRKIEGAFDVGFRWTLTDGLQFDGSSSLMIVVPASADFGRFSVSALTFAASLDGASLEIELSAALAAVIGPVTASVSRLGFIAAFSFPSAGGNLGPAQLEFRFKPPSGLGISIDAGPISGGGFLDFDVDNGRYAGAVALSVFGIQVRAVGLLDTKLPNSTPGYSFLVLITVEFDPIQLGFGFTLNGVGGLCAINRDFVTEALQAALRAHTVDHILFPEDPIKNAPAIVSDLRAIFPPRLNRNVFAPMFKIGWGGDINLLTAELAVIISLPAPSTVAVLGQMQVLLPHPDVRIVVLNLDVLGIIDNAQKRLSIDASLRDSRIASRTVSGDMALRVQWGPNGNGALAIGGLNPHFQPPPGFPTLQRVTIALSSSADLKLTVQCYLAITSNTFQIGANAELYAASGSFNIYGWLGFDALFARHPFRFVADVTAGFALRRGTTTLMGISFNGTLSGTSPWHAKGEAHISLWFFDVGVSFDKTWGDNEPALGEAQVDAWPLLQAAIADLRNWSAALPANIPCGVNFANASTDAGSVPPILIEPSGALTFRERVLPLTQVLERFGGSVPGPQNTFTLDTVSLRGDGLPYTIVREQFAPAQFENLSDQDKLSRPSFEDADAGFSTGGDQIAFGKTFARDVAFNDIYIDDKGPRPAGLRYRITRIAQLRLSATSGAAASTLRAAALGRYAPRGLPQLVTMTDETFVVAAIADLQMRADITHPVSKGDAWRALRAHLALNPGDRDQLQVVPLHEAAA
jgi:hypothetical protein